MRAPVLLSVLLLTGCKGYVGDPGAGPGTGREPDEPGPAEGEVFVPAPATLHRLTREEYRNTLRDLMPEGTPIPDALEVDTFIHGFSTVGGSELTIPPLAAEQYENAAIAVASAVFDDEGRRGALLGCEPTSADDACTTGFIADFGRRAFRRALSAEEEAAFAALAADVGARLRSPVEGLRWTLVAILQSPDFLFRVELGEADPGDTSRYRYTSTEMASRLSYLLWRSTPDAQLLDAGERGALVTDDGLRREVQRMLDDPRAAPALSSFFGELISLQRLDAVAKDPDLYPEWTPSLRAAMRQELELLFAEIALDDGADFRDLFDTDVTFVDAELAALYDLPPPTEDFERTILPPEAQRGGLLGRAGILALFSHATLTSPTKRGRFVRMGLLCEDIPPPPPGVDTTLAEDAETGPQTLRERLEEHRANPACASCHERMDPIGFALERFGPLGEYRETEGGLPIDTATDLDGEAVADAAELGAVLAEDDRLAGCVARRLYRYATGHLEEEGEEVVVASLTDAFRDSGHRFVALVEAIVLSPGFRYALPPAGATGGGACITGERRACDASCGTGEQVCAGGAWGECTFAPAAETCDGADDDCDGMVDEGLGTRLIEGTFADLIAHHPGCDGVTEVVGPSCNAAISRYCTATGCSAGGFGPVESSGTVAHFTCVDGQSFTTSYSVLRTHHDVCDGTRERMGPNCNAAFHRFCAANGFVSGFGPAENSGDVAVATCVRDAETRSITYGVLATHHPSCTSATRIGGACNAAIKRYCVSEGFVSGFGPVENSGDSVAVTCVGGAP